MPAQESRPAAPALCEKNSIEIRPRRSRLLGSILAVATTLLLALPSFAGDLGYFEARRIHRQADEALARGDHDKAAELYHQLADGLDRNQKRRGKALYGAALARLNAGEHETAGELLTEMLQVFPNHENKVGAQAMQALLASQTATPAPPPEPVAEPEPAEPAAGDDQRVGRLESKVARLEGQLREAREELQKKEEAIEKLKELVVGEGG